MQQKIKQELFCVHCENFQNEQTGVAKHPSVKYD